MVPEIGAEAVAIHHERMEFKHHRDEEALHTPQAGHIANDPAPDANVVQVVRALGIPVLGSHSLSHLFGLLGDDGHKLRCAASIANDKDLFASHLHTVVPLCRVEERALKRLVAADGAGIRHAELPDAREEKLGNIVLALCDQPRRGGRCLGGVNRRCIATFGPRVDVPKAEGFVPLGLLDLGVEAALACDVEAVGHLL